MIWSANVKPDNLFFILFKIFFFYFFYIKKLGLNIPSQPSNLNAWTHLINKAIQIYKCSFRHIQQSTKRQQKKTQSFCQCVFSVAVSLLALRNQNFFLVFHEFLQIPGSRRNLPFFSFFNYKDSPVPPLLRSLRDCSNITKQQRGEKQRRKNNSNLCWTAAIPRKTFCSKTPFFFPVWFLRELRKLDISFLYQLSITFCALKGYLFVLCDFHCKSCYTFCLLLFLLCICLTTKDICFP